MIRHSQHHRGTRRGAAVVEFAFVLPVFLLVVLGMIELGRGFLVEHVLAQAVRRGARQATLNGSTETQVENLVKATCAESLGVGESAFSVTVTVTTASGAASNLASATTGSVCTVAVSVPFDQVSTLGAYLGGEDLTSSCTMEHE